MHKRKTFATRYSTLHLNCGPGTGPAQGPHGSKWDLAQVWKTSPLPALLERPLHPAPWMLPTETQSVQKQLVVPFTWPNSLIHPDWMKQEHHFTNTEAISGRNTWYLANNAMNGYDVCSVAWSCQTLCNCSPPGSSVHGILLARILAWGAMPSSRGSPRPRDRTFSS